MAKDTTKGGMRLPGKGMSWKEFLVSLKDEWKGDEMSDVAKSVTFAGVLALFPFLIFLVALAGLVIDPRTLQELIEEIRQVTPEQVTEIIAGRLTALQQQSNAKLLTIGALTAFWAASGGITALIRALNAAYDVKESRPLWKVRGIAILMTLFAAVSALLAALIAVAAPAAAGALGEPLGTILLLLRLPVAALLTMLMWAVLYYVLPDVEQEFRLITLGSVVGVVLWVAASWGFSVYVSNFGKYNAVYGTLGGVVVMLLWMWISAQALLLGAEINALLEHKSPAGKREGAKSLAERGTSEEQAASEPQELLPAASTARRNTRRPRLASRLWLAGAALAFLQLRRHRAR